MKMEIPGTLDIYLTSPASDYQPVHAQTTPIIPDQSMRMARSWVEEHPRSICLKLPYVPCSILDLSLTIRWTRIRE